MLIPRQPTPPLTLPLTGGGTFELAGENPEFATLVVFYRGLHCPICATYLKELERLTPEFAARGVTTIAISSDTGERASEMAAKIGASNLRFAHSLPLGEARRWGLFISTSRGRTSIGIEDAGAVLRARCLPCPRRWHALFRIGPDHAVRPPAFPGDARRSGFRPEKRLPGARRIHRGRLSRKIA